MLRIQNLSKAYGDQVVFDDVDVTMTPGERLGLVGRNGSGKTTLFRILLGEETADAGRIEMPKGYTIGHLSQHLEFAGPTILDDVAVALGDRVDTERYRAEAALMGLGFSKSDLARPADEFSGGYQIRINLARVLVQEPNLLLLDEPTNYLDIVSVRWLGRFLRSWRNELVLITHDRGFLDTVTTHSMIIHRRKLRRMEGTVEKLVDQIATEEEVYENARLNEQKKRRQEERFIERFRAKNTKARQVQSRIKALERRGEMDALETEEELRFHFHAAPFHATTMMTVSELRFAFPGGPDLVGGLSLTVEKGDRIGIIGPNGKGKTTLLNLLADELAADAGEIKLNPNTRIAYFGQTNIARLHLANTVEEELLAARPEQTRSQVRGLAGLLMFSGDRATKPIEVLSGGERSRVLLGKLLVSPANLLLLDEPTNHLDIESIEGLLDAVDAFPGAVLIVTHNERILERLATRLVVFDGDRTFLFQSGYRDFLERVGWQSESDGAGRPAAKGSPKDLRRARAELVTARNKLTRPLEKGITSAEKEIERLEAEVARDDRAMEQAAQDGRADELARLAAEAKRKRERIDECFDELERLTAELDRTRTDFDARLAELT